MKKLRFAAGLLCCVCVLTGLLAACVWHLGTWPALMEGLMARHAEIGTSGLPPEELPGAVRMICAFLRGEAPEFQYAFADGAGTQFLCFNAREQAHMADVRRLFALCGALRWLLCALPAVLLWGHRRSFWRGWLAGSALVCGALLFLLGWGLISFDALFVRFHRLFFTNDLWLMDPARDLIIRLMPEAFFVRYAALIAGAWGAGLLLSVGCGLYRRRKTEDG